MQNRTFSRTEQVSRQAIARISMTQATNYKPVTHHPGLFCYPSSRFGPGGSPLPPGERANDRSKRGEMKPEDVKTAEDARAIAEERGLSHVKVGVFDADGVLRGKYMGREKFFS